MYILKRKYIRTEYKTEAVMIWAAIIVDTSSELSAKYGELELISGSIAIVIDSGTVYALNSSGEWIEQSNITIAI